MLTARQLNVTEKERDALIWLREELRSGRIRHGERGGFDIDIPCGIVVDDNDDICDTVACIGGWMWIHMHGINPTAAGKWLISREQEMAASEYVTRYGIKHSLLHLFYPPLTADYDSVTPQQAADAIDNFLHCGDPEWEHVLKEQRRDGTHG
jgi:hypothetical protein